MVCQSFSSVQVVTRSVEPTAKDKYLVLRMLVLDWSCDGYSEHPIVENIREKANRRGGSRRVVETDPSIHIDIGRRHR